MIMLVVGMILVTPAMACSPNVQAEQDSSNTSTDCPACSLSSEYAEYSDAKVETIELSEKEQKKAIAQAFSDKSVSKLRDELTKSGYVSSIEEFNVSRATTITENETVTTTLVAIPFDGTNENESAVIVFASNKLGSAAVAGVQSDGEITILQYDSVEDQVQIRGAACDFCLWAALKICNYLADGSCAYACGQIALKVTYPPWIAILWVTCYIVCDFVVTYEACNWSSSEICQEAGVC